MHDGTCLIRCYLWASDVAWSQELVEHFLDDLADFLRECGFGNSEDGELRSLVTAGNVALPESDEEWISDLSSDPAVDLILLPSS